MHERPRHEAAVGVLLAGGGSRRMGQPKHALDFGGETAAARLARVLGDVFGDVCVSANDPAPFAPLGLPVVADRRPGEGPLAGLAAALAAFPGRDVFVLACDLPLADEALIRALGALFVPGAAAAMPETNQGLQPACAFYAAGVAPALDQALAAGRRSAVAFAESLEPARLEAGDASPWARALFNVNTPDDVETVRGWIG